jgi:hypothetical protein
MHYANLKMVVHNGDFRKRSFTVMKNLCLRACVLLLFNSYVIFAAEPEHGKLFIQNDHPAMQFECRYKVNGKEYGPITVYQEPVLLCTIRDITDVSVKRYGSVMGLGAQYYHFEDELHKCRSQANRDWTLHITTGLAGWTVQAREKTVVEHPAINRPFEYFRKAASYEVRDLTKPPKKPLQPRHALDLTPQYTKANVNERQQLLAQEIRDNHTLSAQNAAYVSSILELSCDYARRLLTVPKDSPQYQKMLIEWRGQLHPERVAHGKQIACDIVVHNPQRIANQAQYLDAIIDLMWYFYAVAIEKGQAFEQGTFVIQDNDHAIYNFLMNYVKMVNPAITGTLRDPASTISSNVYVYSRLSSHFKQEQERFRHYGIDIRYPGYTIAQALLPAQKSHILFGDLGNGYIFIKMEDAGIAFLSVAQHAIDYLLAQVRKPMVKYYLETYAPAYIDDLVNNYIGTDDDPNYRKERVPQDVLERSFGILEKGSLTPEQKLRITLQFTQQGIHGIINELKNPACPLSAAQRKQLIDYLKELVATEGLDHQDIRYGKEVIISRNHIARGCR